MKKVLFQGVSGEVVFPKDSLVKRLVSLQNSAVRACYRFLRKYPKATDSEIYRSVKPRYLDLPARYFMSGLVTARQLSGNPKVIFGGRKNKRRYDAGEISRKRFLENRDRVLYSRGDGARGGNPCMRIEKVLGKGTCLVIVQNRKKEYFPFKFSRFDEFSLRNSESYGVRLTRIRGRKFKIDVMWNGASVEVLRHKPGAIGVDVNPTRIAWAEVDGEGNFQSRGEIVLPRVTSAKSSKRDQDILLAAKELVELARAKGKKLVVEKLNFGKWTARPKGKKRHRSFSRMKHNFCYRAILTAIQRRSAKFGIPCEEVFAGYSSIIGLAKFARMYSLSRHGAAALVIARRGIGITKERQNFEILEPKERKPQGSVSDQEAGSLPAGRGSAAQKSRVVSVRLKPVSALRLSQQWLRESRGWGYTPADIEASKTRRGVPQLVKKGRQRPSDKRRRSSEGPVRDLEPVQFGQVLIL